MKNECDIVGDLLFSYNDGVLSKTSNDFVEEHLKNCEKCSKILEEIKNENNIKEQVKEIDFLKKIKNKISKKNSMILIVSIILSIIIMFNVRVMKNYKDIASTMEVYFVDDVTEEQIENVKNKLTENSNTIELEYVSKEKALERINSNVKNNTELSNKENDKIMPSIELKTDADIKELVKSIQNMPGILYITTHENVNPYKLYLKK